MDSDIKGLFEREPEEMVIEIEIERLRDFKNHPFKIRDDLQMRSLKESIQKYGILTPLIVRPVIEGHYEIISGHRRRFIAKMLGFRKVPVIIRVLRDDEAVIAMVDANNQREKVSLSEKAFAFKMKMDAMKRQGKRRDLTSGQNGPKLTAEAIGKESGDSVRQVKRYIRLTELIPDFLDMVDRKRLNFTIAVDISYIDKQTQEWLYEYIHENGFIKPNQITGLRKYLNQESSAMTQPLMISILNSVIPVKAPAKKVTLNEPKLMKYFPADYSPKQMEQIIVSLLEQWKNGQEGVDQNVIS